MPMPPQPNVAMPTRRDFLAASLLLASVPKAFAASPLWFRWLLASAMYGQEPIETVLAEASTLGIGEVDLWPKVHGAQREAIDERGADAVRELLAEQGCTVACLTRYDLGTERIAPEIAVAEAVGADTIVTGPKGSRTPPPAELKAAVRRFVDGFRATHDAAAEAGVTIAIENHRRNLFEAADSLRYLAEFAADMPSLAIALAPAHLPQEPDAIAALIRDLGPKIAVFYAWERGDEFIRKQPTGREREQLPGRGSFDFAPLVAALDAIDYDGYTSVFMHPIPRGIPAAGSVEQTTAEIAAAMHHLESLTF